MPDRQIQITVDTAKAIMNFSSNLSSRLGWNFLWPFPPKILNMVASIYLFGLFWLALPHELLHYIPARLLGMEAYIEPGVTRVEKTEQIWKDMLVTLTPAFFSLLLVGFCIWMSSQAQGKWHVFWLIETAAAVATVWGCVKDFQHVWKLVSK
jgi:hypothetical protein